MKHLKCDGCGGQFPMNETFKVFDHTLCEACGEKTMADYGDKEVPEGAIEPKVDPTVCGNCDFDAGERQLQQLMDVPLCDRCDDFFRHRPFPAWIKIAFTGLVALAVLSFALNWRFMKGFVEARQAVRAIAEGNVEKASAKATAAAKHVPESKELQLLADFYRGLLLLSEDRSAEALPLLRRGAALSPAEAEVLILMAEAGAAFDKKDYDAFLVKQKERLQQTPKAPMALAGVASAYACRYAVTGDESFKEQAAAHLERAANIAGKDDADLKEYEERIRHRLRTREIITGEEYDRRFRSEKTEEEE